MIAVRSPRMVERVRRRRAHPPAAALEALESRVLLTTLAGFSIPGLPSGITLTNFPAYTNQFNLGALSSFITPNPNDYWWLQNTGQTLTDATSGPATGTPGADIAAKTAWNITQGSSNVVVAVLDTGIDLANADLSSVLWNNPFVDPNTGVDSITGLTNDTHGWNFLTNSSDVSDNFVHGTAVAATVHSVAPNVTILPVEIGTAAGADAQAVVNGINYLINLKKHGVNIVAINASYISTAPPTMDEVNAIKSAGNAGMLYIAAAGNGSMNLDSLIPNVPSFLQQFMPSFLPSNLMFVAATDNQDNLASFSDYGSHTVAVGAPGVDITLPIPGGLYAPLSGTSFAAPMVSAIAALLESRVPTASLSQIKNAILNSGDLDPALAGTTITGRRVDALKALNYLIGSQLPCGAVESITNSTITGWAYDANLGAAPASVQISIDGTLYPAISADITRPDLIAKLGSSDHGFSFDVPTLGYGKHAVKVFVLDDATGKAKQIGQGTVTVDTAPTGALEMAATKTITGWAFDSDTPSQFVQVRLFLDGKQWMTTSANVNRPDLAGTLGATTRHGYAFKLGTMRAGVHRVDTYAVDTLTGALTLLGSATVSSNQPATGAVEVLNATTISGWAFDADAGGNAIQVQYMIDGSAPVCVTANLSRPDLQAALGSKNHGFSITLPQLTAGEHTITVNAVDANNKSLVLLTQQTLTITDADPLPTGTVTTLTAAQVSGTVSDSAATGPIMVRVDIDGKVGVPFASTVDAGDAGVFDFTFTPPKLSTAPHRVDVYAIDPVSGTAVLLARQLVNYTAPTANLQSLTSTAATGWAIAPSAPNHLAQIRLDVDGFTGALVTANLSRPDLLGTLGASNVGFNIPLPQVAPGDHTVTVWLIDPTTLAATQLGALELTTR